MLIDFPFYCQFLMQSQQSDHIQLIRLTCLSNLGLKQVFSYCHLVVSLLSLTVVSQLHSLSHLGNVPDCSEVLMISIRIGMNSSR